MIHDVNVSARELNDDTDPHKQSQEGIFSPKWKKLPYPSLVFNNSNDLQVSSQKYLGVTLDVNIWRTSQ